MRGFVSSDFYTLSPLFFRQPHAIWVSRNATFASMCSLEIVPGVAYKISVFRDLAAEVALQSLGV
jgi:hypothetical protein